MINITRQITPGAYKPETGMTPKGITYHNTGNASANAAQHAKAQYNGNLKDVAVHYYVDDTSIYQCLEDTEQGWHAGDGKGPGNTTTISIEVCEQTGINQAVCNQNAADLGAYLLKKFGLTTANVHKHQEYNGKYCPRLLIPIWDQFIAMIQASMGSETEKPSGSTYTVVQGDTLTGIASRYGITLGALLAANPQITNPNLIHPGNVLTIPGSGGDIYILIADVSGYYTAKDALSGNDPRTTVRAGTYYVYNESGDAINLTTKRDTPGSWVDKRRNIPGGGSTTFTVGQTVRVKASAKTFVTGETIASFVKQGVYYVRQVKTDSVLIAPSMSGALTGWVYNADVEKG